MKPFLLITTRDDERIAAEEHASYCALTGLLPEDLKWRRAEREPLDDIDLDRHSGIILAGSPFTVSDPVEKKSPAELRAERELAALLARVTERDFPFLGICYGVGTLGTHLGATIDGTYGENTQAARITLSTEGLDDPLFSELPPQFDAFVGHKEAITVVPDRVAVLASSPSCPVQAFRSGRNVYATQFHPELDAASMTSRIHAYVDHGYFDPAEVEALIDRIQRADVRASQMVLARFTELYLK